MLITWTSFNFTERKKQLPHSQTVFSFNIVTFNFVMSENYSLTRPPYICIYSRHHYQLSTKTEKLFKLSTENVCIQRDYIGVSVHLWHGRQIWVARSLKDLWHCSVRLKFHPFTNDVLSFSSLARKKGYWKTGGVCVIKTRVLCRTQLYHNPQSRVFRLNITKD